MSKASDLLVAALQNEGVEQIFGAPGEENLDILEWRSCIYSPDLGHTQWR